MAATAPVITVDGPSGAGKGTLAHLLAQGHVAGEAPEERRASLRHRIEADGLLAALDGRPHVSHPRIRTEDDRGHGERDEVESN